MSVTPVHPHVRGEYILSCCRTVTGSGSSPRAWGIQVYVDKTNGKIRFIPTCVGNTERRAPAQHPGPVHPHVRGEYVLGQGIAGNWSGSSPRAWGIRKHNIWQALISRFIPTCVGNTTPR